MTMPENNLPQRKSSPRLVGYDYAQEGAYFVTVCVQGRLSLFGNIENQSLTLNPAGEMVNLWWKRLPSRFSDVQLDPWIVMPNHFHGIIYLKRHIGKPICTNLSDVMHWFKTMTTNVYIRGVKARQWQAFDGSLWQRSFHDHIIRNEADLQRIQEYVLYNPSCWQEDTFYVE
jgi:putative transposase